MFLNTFPRNCSKCTFRKSVRWILIDYRKAASYRIFPYPPGGMYTCTNIRAPLAQKTIIFIFHTIQNTTNRIKFLYLCTWGMHWVIIKISLQTKFYPEFFYKHTRLFIFCFFEEEIMVWWYINNIFSWQTKFLGNNTTLKNDLKQWKKWCPRGDRDHHINKQWAK